MGLTRRTIRKAPFSTSSTHSHKSSRSPARTGMTRGTSLFASSSRDSRDPCIPPLWDELYRLDREALINAFRHGHANKIEIEVIYYPRRLRILVRDDGCGIDPAILRKGREGHWCLFGRRERADQIVGRFRVISGAPAGTEVGLSVAGTVAFQNGSGGKSSWFGKKGAGK